MAKEYLFSPSEKAFYPASMHDAYIQSGSLPDDVFPVDAELRDEVMAEHYAGKIISIDDAGFPAAADRPLPSAEELAESARADRDAILKASDWVALRAMETGEPMPADWAAYRQALRDVPEQEGFPTAIDWPVSPSAQEV